MSECDEVAENIWLAGPWLIETHDDARFVVRRYYGSYDESPQIIDNLAESLLAIANMSRSES